MDNVTEKRISTTDLDRFYKKEVNRRGKSGVDELVKSKRSTEKDIPVQKTIFLCHSHLDKTIVEKITLLFNKLEVGIYVDWMDTNLPKVTNGDTAELIKEKIQHCNRFIFLATYRGLQSKWCDWELGIAYSLKKVSELALLPIESRTGRWEGSEYLNLYPSMIIGDDLDNLQADEVFIKRPADKLSVSLEEWLQN